MSCRRPSAKKSTRKSSSCCKCDNYRSEDTDNSSFYSDCFSSSDSRDNSNCSDYSNCKCYSDSPPRRRKGKVKPKGRTKLSTRLSKKAKSARTSCNAMKASKKKPARRTKRSSSSCHCSDCDLSDSYSSDGDYCCAPRKRNTRV